MTNDQYVRDLEAQVADLTDKLTVAREALVGNNNDGWWRLAGKFTKQQELIVRTLYNRASVIVPRDALYNVLYGDRIDCDWPNPKILDVVICQVRRKMPKGSVVTCWGRGWRLTDVGRNWIKQHTQGENSHGRLDQRTRSVA